MKHPCLMGTNANEGDFLVAMLMQSTKTKDILNKSPSSALLDILMLSNDGAEQSVWTKKRLLEDKVIYIYRKVKSHRVPDRNSYFLILPRRQGVSRVQNVLKTLLYRASRPLPNVRDSLWTLQTPSIAISI